MTQLLLLLILSLIVILLLLFLLKRPKKALYSLVCTASQKNIIHFINQKKLRLWLKYKIEYSGTEEDWKVKGHLSVKKNGLLEWEDSLLLNFKDNPNKQPRHFFESGTFYGCSSWNGKENRGSFSATVYLGKIEKENLEKKFLEKKNLNCFKKKNIKKKFRKKIAKKITQ